MRILPTIAGTMNLAPCAGISLCAAAVLLATATVAAANDVATCKKQAASDYSIGVRLCEQNQRGLSTRLFQCKREAKMRYDRARAVCDTRARKAGGDPMPVFDWPDPPPPPPPPPKDPKPK